AATWPPSPRKSKPGAESFAMKDSLGREPRWNADRCAPHAFEARPCPSARQRSLASVGVSPPHLLSVAEAGKRGPPPALRLCGSFRALRMANGFPFAARQAVFAV